MSRRRLFKNRSTPRWLCLYCRPKPVLSVCGLNKDRSLYPLRDFAVRHLILKNSSDPYTWGLSSGATGFFSRCIGNHRSLALGSEPLVGWVFGDRTDREQAVLIKVIRDTLILTMDSGWSQLLQPKKLELCYQLIFLVGYDRISCTRCQATGDPQLQAAQQSYSMIRRAVAPSVCSTISFSRKFLRLYLS